MSGAQAVENRELREELKELADAHELVTKDLPQDEIDNLEKSIRFVTAYIAMYNRRDAELVVARDRIKELEKILDEKNFQISQARTTALAGLAEMTLPVQEDVLKEILEDLPDVDAGQETVLVPDLQVIPNPKPESDEDASGP